jgi:hypothetical protein
MRRLVGWIAVAAIGLFVVSGGPATAAKLFTGKDIKDGSVALKDLSKRTKKVLRASPGITITQVEGNTVQLCGGGPPDSCAGTSVAQCPDGMVVTGGGWDTNGGSQDVSVMNNAAGNFSTAWSVVMSNQGSSPTALTAFALCTPGDTPPQ